ncbi:carboxyltransferase domain-containing protein [Paenarthrobacter sp. Z7-10]|uniref:5-oxoprolinase subunit B family protein n=1 Tax=Paenarthrobacter sp. Z7-10 TaxID=2787635 RepID=UPI0022A8F6E9|nr:carboxyltransferase domain-containing protein [Paenarthrobacter sp. Z7-10]MCZ2403871.1 carboxyltransferase domain-containing protein [Paenarthrobacter sp. Z7-10]
MSSPTPAVHEARYTWGGDEFLFIEVSESMSLAANFKVMSIASTLSALALPGIVDVCPANASLLVRFDPDVLPPRNLEDTVRTIEGDLTHHQEQVLETRIIEVPVWYNDPFTADVAGRFREGFHQEPGGTDIDYAAKVNNLKDAAEFIQRHHEQPWLVSMVGFVAGLPFLFQLAEREKQLEVPKYLSPRTDTPKLTVGHGGCFGCIYSVRGAGGYQMFGVAAAPIFDPAQSLADFRDFMVFFRPGDIVKFKPVTEAEYNDIQAQISEGTFRYRQAPVTFELSKALSDPQGSNQELMEALNGI